MDRLRLEMSWSMLWRLFFFGIIATSMFVAREIVLALFLALVVSSGLDGLVGFLERRRIPRPIGVILIFLGAALMAAVVIYFVIPFVIIDLGSLFALDNATIVGRILGPLRESEAGASFADALNNIAGDFFAENNSPFDVFSRILGGVALGLTVLVSSFYLSLSSNGVQRFIRAVFPAKEEERALKIYERSRRRVGTWFQAQIALSAIVGLLVWLSLELLGVRHAFILGLVAAIFEIMPFVGPIISGALAVLIAFTTSPALALYTLIVFLFLQQIESHLLVPLVTKKAVDVHPVIVIISLLIGFKAAGVLGGLVAVPLAAVIQEILDSREPRTPAVVVE